MKSNEIKTACDDCKYRELCHNEDMSAEFAYALLSDQSYIYDNCITYYGGFGGTKKFNRLSLMAIDMSIEVLKKQIPQNVLPENKFYGIGKCPNCGAVFLDNTTEYCGNCGQALIFNNKDD